MLNFIHVISFYIESIMHSPGVMREVCTEQQLVATFSGVANIRIAQIYERSHTLTLEYKLE